jgi:hypothetical protein
MDCALLHFSIDYDCNVTGEIRDGYHSSQDLHTLSGYNYERVCMDNQEKLDLSMIQRADQLHQEADLLMEMISLREILQPFGPIYLTGSYYLDVMVYPDLDLYFQIVSLAQLFGIGAQIARSELVIQVVSEPSVDGADLPGDRYLKARIRYGDWGRPWKLDMWSLPDDVIRCKMAEMEHFRAKISPELRVKIIQYKFAILTPQHRTPKYSGYYIYKAFIDEGLEDFDQVSCYLVQNSIQLVR